MPVYSKQTLSGSPSGLPLVMDTSTATGDMKVLHRVQATSTNAIETVWLNVQNGNSGPRLLVLHLSGTATREIVVLLPQRDEMHGVMIPILQGLPLTGTDTVISGTANGAEVHVSGFVNRIVT